MNEILSRIWEEIEKQGKKPTEICKEADISSSTFFTWKTKDKVPPTEPLQRIAECLNVSMDYLVTGRKDPYAERERRKTIARKKINDESLPIDERYNAKLDEYHVLFDRSLEQAEYNGYSDVHPKFNQYVAMMVNQQHEKERTPIDIYNKLKNEYGTLEGLTDKSSYWQPSLTARDEKDIARRLQQTLSELEAGQDGLMFSGEPLDDETRELLKISLENSIRLAKVTAKEKFTPKKYKK